ncbi:THUMP domain-containing protein [Gangjinia marincola]|uniref:THUMP domain-containing protein n=1 Tax=Gangjinia marincola TaxID=578463 RepID=A0ABN1MGH9_9FLAO
MSNNFKMIAKTLYGLEDVLAKELVQLGAMNVSKGNRLVSFEGDKGFMYKANLSLRTALRILKPIYDFRARNEETLYSIIKKFDWERFMRVDDTFYIESTIFSDHFKHSQYVALKMKDAIVDRFREIHNRRPSIDKDHPNVRLFIHIDRDKVSISLDSSGDSLHKRGYRFATNIAPMNEVLAAGSILLSGWTGDQDFLDPMCGSGTIPIEAAMIACNIPPNINRKEFGFEKWSDWDEDLFEVIEESVLKKIKELNVSIIGYDKSPSAIQKAKENTRNANLSDFISYKNIDFFKTNKDKPEKSLHMVFNPPYGERIAINMEEFYSNLGDTLKQSYPSTNSWFITSNLEAIKHVGLKPSRKIKLFSGKLEGRLVKYEMYAGTKKVHKRKEES